jgi:hypothetical protein
VKTPILVLLGWILSSSIACNNNNDNPSAVPLTPSPTPTTTAPATSSAFTSLGGTWSGEWIDTRFNVRGTLVATFTVNGTAVTSVGRIGLQSLGLGDEAGTGTGTINGNILSFTFEAQTVGNGEGTLDDTGASGKGTVAGVLDFGDFTFEGSVNETTIDGTFTFTDPAGGRGTAQLTRQ